MNALTGIRIIDVTSFLSGPYGTQILAGLGAEVIKVEMPQGGDPARISPPFAGPQGAKDRPQTEDDLSFGFLKRNRNKKSVAIDLKKEAGKELFLEMVRQADVVVENFRPGTMAKLGLSYDKLREVNPKIIYCSLSGFGLSGAYSDMPAFDIVIQAMSGLMSINGDPASPPMKAGLTLGDLAGGLYSVIGIMAALRYRELTGEGQLVEVSMLDSLMSLLMDEAPDFWAKQGVSPRMGNRLLRLTPFNSYQAEDGWLVIAGGNDAHWQKILEAIDRHDLKEEPRYLKQADRTANADEVDQIIGDWTGSRSVAEAVATLQQLGIPCAPVKDISQVLEDKVLREERKVLVDVNHPTAGKIAEFQTYDIPVKFSQDEAKLTKPAPVLGEHTRAILADLGISEARLETLAAEGVIYDGQQEKQESKDEKSAG